MAVDNFLAFKKLMLKRNRDLNEEAMQIMNASEAGIDPSLVYQQHNYGGAVNEDDEIARAIQASLELEKNKSSGHDTTPAESGDDEEMRLALEASKLEYETSQAKKKEEEEKLEKDKAKKEKEKIKKEKAKESKIKTVEKEPELAPVKAPKTLAPIGGAKPVVAADFDIQKQAEQAAKQQKKNEEEKKKELEKKTLSKDEMKERMDKLRQQRDILLKKKQESLQKEWDEYEHDDKDSGDSRKDMIQKGLGALGIKETSIKYKTEEEKEKEKERLRQEKLKKEEEEQKSSDKKESSKKSPEKSSKLADDEESDEMKRRRMIYNKIKQLNLEEGNDF